MPAHHVVSSYRTFLFNKIVEDWSELATYARPQTLWVAEHEPPENPDLPLNTPVVHGWYFDGNEFHERPISDVAAFLNFAAGYPHTTRCFEIGMAGFALIANSRDVALFWHFGCLHGTGYRCAIRDNYCSCDEVWRS